jgi:hypothetical protein
MSSAYVMRSINNVSCAMSVTGDQIIHSPQDFLDMMAWGGENGTNLLLLQEPNFAPAFYDLKTGLAGEILQKLSNYGCRLAIHGSFASVRSERFRELMREANKGSQLRFAESRDEALAWLAR